VADAIVDTGPLLHLHEIGQLQCLAIFDHLLIPDLVAGELSVYGIDPLHSGIAGMNVSIARVGQSEWAQIVDDTKRAKIHPADAQVVVLARQSQLQKLVLTDDMDLRRLLESEGAVVVGSVGILVRAYTEGRLARVGLEGSIDALFTNSTLHISRAFKAYVTRLLDKLP